MEMHQLRYAAEVARQGSFTAAATALHVSQSGVSAQVAKLERELGHRLFDRHPRLATPTAEGAALLTAISGALEAVDRIRTVADDLAGITRGAVRVGTVIGCTIPGYLAGFAEFRTAHPGVEVRAVEGNSADLVDGLLAGDLDVALVAHADPLPDSLEAYTFVDEPLAIVAAPGHPLASRSSITVDDLAEFDVITLPAGTGIRSALEKTCAAAGIECRPAVEVHSPETALALARRGAGVAVLSTSMLHSDAGLTAIGLADSAPNALSLVTRNAPGAAARALARTLRARLG
ncbi:putative LysR family transcriptional regulator [Gordonia araii NBRC 100433]|uniref:Putative LysR family transcriptional regulator n=1 Tax=Gordonia araii NBRC 100433 TaxID=1073574 RepID=G7H136_9ACTN|nr:LysR family transcriptional regulator [Gordonia araii]NNG96717.1 LysR family transcriptional regulator [Gordonia araii NBRC 100433]GAB09597.1 putative LysR family transcriptional regulator [Gordonia araii NBRC 100433]